MPLHAPLALASGYPPYLVAMIAGFVIGTFGHIVRSTTIIVLGIAIIGATSVGVLIAISAS